METLKLKGTQTEKQQQDDNYKLNSLIREKEALAKADIRKLQESFRDVFEEFSKSLSQKDSSTRQDIEGKIHFLEKVWLSPILKGARRQKDVVTTSF